MNSVFKNAAVIRHFKRYGLLPRLLALLLTSCLSLPQIYLPRRSQADHVTVLSKTLQWLLRTKLRILNQHSECLRTWTLCHLPLFLALPWHSRLKWPQTAHDSQDMAFFFCVCSCGFLCHAPPSFLDLWPTHSAGAAPLLESSPGPLSHCICIVPEAGPDHIHVMWDFSIAVSTCLWYKAEPVSSTSPSLTGATQRGVWDQEFHPDWTVDNCSQQAGLSWIERPS